MRNFSSNFWMSTVSKLMQGFIFLIWYNYANTSVEFLIQRELRVSQIDSLLNCKFSRKCFRYFRVVIVMCIEGCCHTVSDSIICQYFKESLSFYLHTNKDCTPEIIFFLCAYIIWRKTKKLHILHTFYIHFGVELLFKS